MAGAASKNWKDSRSFRVVHRSGTSIYRKKIDTQKVYVQLETGSDWRVSLGGAMGAGPGVFGEGVKIGRIKKERPKAYSTQCSQVVSHLSTNWA